MNQRFRSHRISRRGLVTGATMLGLGTRTTLATQRATPVNATVASFTDRFGTVLDIAPSRELSANAPLAFYHADLEQQMQSVDIELPDPNVPPTDLPEGFYEASLALPLAAQAYVSGLTPEWFETFGFNPFGVRQVITLNAPPNVVSIFLADFDVPAIEATLEASGYELAEPGAAGAYWSVGDELDLESMVGQLGIGMMNHAAVYDHALAFGQQAADIQAVAQVVAGLAPSMAEQGIWSNMAGLFPPDTVGLIPVSPAMLDTQPGPPSGRAATPIPAAQGATSIDYLAFGVRAGSLSKPLSLVGEGTPEATPASTVEGVPAQVEVRIRYGSEATAKREAAAIADRWQQMQSVVTGQPYSRLMQLDTSAVHEQDALVVAVSFTSDVPNRWIQLVQMRDLLPFIPPAG